MHEDTATAWRSISEAVEELLRQLVDARFVLTDREGAVTRWSRPAEELFGWPGTRMLGRSFVDTLALAAPLPAAGGQLATPARRKDGGELELALTLVPVRMSQSLEFNGFLEALEIAAPRGDALTQLQQSHRAVVDWIQAALQGDAELEDDGLAAGTIVAFRPLNEPVTRPPSSSDLDELDDAREAAQAGLESELAATRERLEQIESDRGEERERLEQIESDRGEERERLEELERSRDEERRGIGGELAQTGERIEALERALASVHERSETEQRSAVQVEQRLRAEVEELRGGMAELVEGAGRQNALGARLDETSAFVEELGVRIEQVQAEAGGDEEARRLLSDLHEELGALRSGTIERDHDRDELRAIADEVRSAVETAEQARTAADERLAGMEKLAGERSSQLDALTTRAESAATATEDHMRRMAAATEVTEQRTGETLEAAEAAERRAAEVLRAAEAAAGAARDAQRAAEVAEAQAQARARVPLGGSAGANGSVSVDGAAAAPQDDRDAHRPLFGPKRNAAPAREPRGGFDDAAQPMATIEVDGHFRELNRPFSDLVGYSEEDFRAAVWPPVMDRANLLKHREQLQQLLDGQIESAEVDTGYVHAQGLLVPVAGTISLVKQDETPDHFLLVVS